MKTPVAMMPPAPEGEHAPAADESVGRPIFPVAHSIPATDAVLTAIASTYALGAPVACSLIRGGWNDTYRVETADDRYILRVCGAGRRSLTDLRYELDFLLHLARVGVGVSTPVARADGHRIGILRAPEGDRFTILFTHAPGSDPQPSPFKDAVQAGRFGRALAALHNAGDTFSSPYPRPARDLRYLLDKPLAAFRPLLAHRPADWDYVTTVAEVIRARITALADAGLRWGTVHRDPCSGNATVTADGRVTWFDFEHCGPGWTAQDLASAYGIDADDAGGYVGQGPIWQALLSGYHAVRPVMATELAALPALVVANSFFFMEANLEWATVRGHEYWASDEHFTDWFTGLRQLMARYAQRPVPAGDASSPDLNLQHGWGE